MRFGRVAVASSVLGLSLAVLGSAVLGSAVLCSAALAQSYPARPIRLIIPYSPGGGNDVIARPIAAKLAERLGQPVIVENKPGAQAIIGVEYVAKAAPDGYTLLVAPSGPMTINPAIYRQLGYAPLRDFSPVSLMGEFPLVLAVAPKLGVGSVNELIGYLKAQPLKANYSASASPFQLAAELFSQRVGVGLLHIPFKGSGDSVNAVASGEVTMTLSDAGPIAGAVQGGLLKALAVTSSARHPAFPGIPTLMEAGYADLEITLFSGVVAPAGTPPEIIKRLAEEIAGIVVLPEIRDRLALVGITAVSSTPEAYAKRIERDIARWTAVAKAANITAD